MMDNTVRSFVTANERWFRGRLPETDATLGAAESKLKLTLPACVRHLLREYGYWHATGIDSLDESVSATQAFRDELQLPQKYLVLNYWHDAGVVLTDTDGDDADVGPPVYWIGQEDVPEGIGSGTTFTTFLDYLRDRLDDARDFIEPKDIDYDPASDPLRDS